MRTPSAAGNKALICDICFRMKRCKETGFSWVLLFTGLIATVSIRAVNIALDFNPPLAKVFWYTGIGGFSVYFLYKFRSDVLIKRGIERSGIRDKLLKQSPLGDDDYKVLGTVICRLSSRKDMINYFFIFLTSALALGLGIYQDFLKKG